MQRHASGVAHIALSRTLTLIPHRHSALPHLQSGHAFRANGLLGSTGATRNSRFNLQSIDRVHPSVALGYYRFNRTPRPFPFPAKNSIPPASNAARSASIVVA